MFSTRHCFEKTNMISRHSHLRDVMDQSYPMMPVLVLITSVIHRECVEHMEHCHITFVEKLHLKRRGRKALIHIVVVFTVMICIPK